MPDYAMCTISLRGKMAEKNGRKMAGISHPRVPLKWTEQALSDFLTLKFILTNPLVKPHYSTPFRLDVSIADDGQMANACLYQ